MHPLTWQVLLVVHEVVRNYKVPGQVKHRLQENYCLIPNLDPFGDNIKGAKGRNTDTLQVEENRRDEG